MGTFETGLGGELAHMLTELWASQNLPRAEVSSHTLESRGLWGQSPEASQVCTSPPWSLVAKHETSSWQLVCPALDIKVSAKISCPPFVTLAQ